MIVVAHKEKPNIESGSFMDKRLFMSLIHSVWNIRPETRIKDHPAPYPVILPKRLLYLLTGVDDLILDPFAGSFTTGVACLQTGRRFIGCEIDPGYFEIGRKRMEQAALQPPLFTTQATTTDYQQPPLLVPAPDWTMPYKVVQDKRAIEL